MTIKQLDEFDFGFTAVSEDELKAMERQLQQQVDAKSKCRDPVRIRD